MTLRRYPLSLVQQELLRRVLTEKELLTQAIAHEAGVPDGAPFTTLEATGLKALYAECRDDQCATCNCPNKA